MYAWEDGPVVDTTGKSTSSHSSRPHVISFTLKRRWTLQWGLPLALAATVILGIALSSRSPETSVSPVATVTLIDGGEKLPSGLDVPVFQ